MRISLINPPFVVKGAYYHNYMYYKPYPNPALAILASVCRHNNVEYQMIDAKLEELSFEQTVNKIVSYAPDVVAVTIPTTTEAYEDFQFIGEIKNRLPGVVVVAGGPHVSALPQRSLAECPEMDIVVTGLGENIFHRLINNGFRTLESVGSIWWRGDDGCVAGGMPVPKEMEAFPPLRWSEFPPAQSYMITSCTGCPYDCNYCYNVSGRRTYFKEVEAVVAELEEIYEYAKPAHFLFADPTFAVNRKHTERLLRHMIEKGINKKLTWMCFTRTDAVDEELLRLMKDAGCIFVSYGIESGSERVLKLMRKNASLAGHKKAIVASAKVGIDYQTFFIFGHVGETPREVKESIALIAELNPKTTIIGIMVPWPGTDVYMAAANQQHGLSLVPVEYPQGWQLYDKHFGKIMDNSNFRPRELELLRIWAYLWMYLANHRYWDLLAFSWEVKAVITGKLRRLFS